MADWFRNREWDDAIAADFDSRLARARDKAQPLLIQAYVLLSVDAEAAARLCRRAIALELPEAAARSFLYLGTALALTGDTDGAIVALDQAVEAERRDPRFRTAAHVDQALLVAVARRTDMYDAVLDRLAAERALRPEDQDPSATIALALILADRGADTDEAVALARAAHAQLGESGDGVPGSTPGPGAPALQRRLASIFRG